jgi:hypothetical protein
VERQVVCTSCLRLEPGAAVEMSSRFDLAPNLELVSL